MKNNYKCILFLALFFSYTAFAQTKTDKPINSSVQATSPWLTGGNAGTVPSLNFLGTTDTNRLVFRTNNIERATILSNGNFGLGTANPTKTVFIQGSKVSSNAELYVKQLPGSNLGAYISLDNTSNTNGKLWSIGSTGSLNYPAVNGSLEFYQYGVGTRMIIDSFGRLGIGIVKPTAQLHTTGTVRFAGLANSNTVKRILGVDSLGNVFYTTLNASAVNNWSLTGNAGTNPSLNFLGTTDTARLAFRTNNTQKMVILSNGNVGIGTSFPPTNLAVQGNTTSQEAAISIKQVSSSTLGSYLTLDNTANANGKSWSIGSTGSLNYPGVNGSLEFYQLGAGTRMIIDSFGHLGIGIVKPTAQLHTTGTVRFAGLVNSTTVKRILGVDSLGNVYYTALPASSSNNWSLTGNAGTIPGTNFIGTTDAQRLVLKANNIERFTILPNGYTGINNSAPGKLLSLAGANTADNAEIQVKQLAGSSLGAYLTLDNTANGGKWWSIGSTGTLNSPAIAGALEFYQYGFGTRMMLDQSGNLGLSLGNGVLPTANLHVNGTVRFQGLPSGGGNLLVIDKQGNLHISSSSVTNTVNTVNTDTPQNIEDLQSEVNDLKEQIIELKALIKTCNPGVAISDKAVLFQNIPNPSSTASTLIKLYIPDSKRGDLVITDIEGNVRKRFSSLQSGNQQVSVSGSELGNGTFIYSLYVNGMLFQSKKMIIAQ